MVASCLHDLERGVVEIMVPVGSSFDDFDFVVDAFLPARMDGVVAMVEDAIAVLSKRFGKLVKGRASDWFLQLRHF